MESPSGIEGYIVADWYQLKSIADLLVQGHVCCGIIRSAGDIGRSVVKHGHEDHFARI